MMNKKLLLTKMKEAIPATVGATIAFAIGAFAICLIVYSPDTRPIRLFESVQGRVVSFSKLSSGKGNEVQVIDLEVMGAEGCYAASNRKELRVESFELAEGLESPNKGSEIVAKLSDETIADWRLATPCEHDAAVRQREKRQFALRFTLVLVSVFSLLFLGFCSLS